ncbi:MAG: 16S rRNA (cytosine(1402)-N(4))-methyltransferase RsmH [Cyanobacteria bacterium]|nr:16S rRNA (cytosine(1402)-N(4))-methyltransferase RsmH [Cyanobacteriota bacterium]
MTGLAPQNLPHIPVMLSEVLGLWKTPTQDDDKQPPERLYIDGTAGAGGHSAALLETVNFSGHRLLLFDQDPSAVSLLKTRFENESRVSVIQDNFARIGDHLPAQGITGGILVDLGVSSMQLDQAERGFSFQKEAPLDMRMDTTRSVTAADWLSHASEKEIQQVLQDYGEEHYARSIARSIVETRQDNPITHTKQLAELVSHVYRRRMKGKAFHQLGIHPATRTFQAIRIAVNEELSSLTTLLESLPDLMAPGSTAVFISFHSLEDRIVKQFFQTEMRGCVCPPRFPICRCGHVPRFKALTKKPITASPSEIEQNPRSRSAKVRAYIRLEC